MKNSRIIKMILMFLIMAPMFVSADDIQSTYNGEYSIDYLVRNYNLVEFRMNTNNQFDFLNYYGLKRENVNFSIEGPVLINGDYYNDDFQDDLRYSWSNPKNAISFISGIKADYLQTPSKTAINSDFIDFDKLYKQVLSESKALVDKSDYHINEKDIHINKPGIYQINSTRYDMGGQEYSIWSYFYLKNGVSTRIVQLKEIYIDNYDPNQYYIFNNMKTYEFDNYVIFIKSKDDNTFLHIDDFIDSENYSGNIIFNYPNAKVILSLVQGGKIVAPNADVFITSSVHISRPIFDYNLLHYESIFANSITSVIGSDGVNSELIFEPYSSSKKIEFDDKELKEVIEIEDFEDDIYTGTYSIYEMLQNYNIVALGQKMYESNTKFYKENTSTGGHVNLFHVAGQVLINGQLVTSRIDLESNRVNESNIGDIMGVDDECSRKSFKRWGDGDTLTGTNSVVFQRSSAGFISGRQILSAQSYINYERLYEKIVEEQKEIKNGDLVKQSNGVAHIEIGKNYYIENINDIKEIVFDNFDQNSEKLTVITVLNTGNINFPLLSQTNEGNYVSTKDYYGKKEPMFEYEYYNFPEDIYHGNIIWNIPGAKYIKLASNAPFFGHVIAPNADVETEETHFAGSFIVNSLYAEGNSEAHFYPLQPLEVPQDFDCLTVNQGFFGGKWNVNVDPIVEEEEITNPKTLDNYITITIVLILMLLFSAVSIFYIKKKQQVL